MCQQFILLISTQFWATTAGSIKFAGAQFFYIFLGFVDTN